MTLNIHVTSAATVLAIKTQDVSGVLWSSSQNIYFHFLIVMLRMWHLLCNSCALLLSNTNHSWLLMANQMWTLFFRRKFLWRTHQTTRTICQLRLPSDTRRVWAASNVGLCCWIWHVGTKTGGEVALESLWSVISLCVHVNIGSDKLPLPLDSKHFHDT